MNKEKLKIIKQIFSHNLKLNPISKDILKICNKFLKIPSTISNEKPFLDYLNKKYRIY